MSRIAKPLELFKHLPRTNCGDCRISTCLAFAAAVIKEEKRLADCPHLDRDLVTKLDGSIERQVNLETIQEDQLRELQGRIAGIPLSGRAAAIGATMGSGTLVVNCLGRNFEVDAAGNVRSHCHTHPWFSLPLLDYILTSTGGAASNRWVPFRELTHGRTWQQLFERRCERPLKELADSHSELFDELTSLFSAASSDRMFDADISVLLQPLPRVPLLLCYWKPEDGMESKLHLFFDASAEEHLHIESLFTLGTGIVRMFEKIMLKHTDKRLEIL